MIAKTHAVGASASPARGGLVVGAFLRVRPRNTGDLGFTVLVTTGITAGIVALLAPLRLAGALCTIALHTGFSSRRMRVHTTIGVATPMGFLGYARAGLAAAVRLRSRAAVPLAMPTGELFAAGLVVRGSISALARTFAAVWPPTVAALGQTSAFSVPVRSGEHARGGRVRFAAATPGAAARHNRACGRWRHGRAIRGRRRNRC